MPISSAVARMLSLVRGDEVTREAVHAKLTEAVENVDFDNELEAADAELLRCPALECLLGPGGGSAFVRKQESPVG